MKIAIISPGTLPLPAKNGGAVEQLIDSLIVNHTKENVECVCYSIESKDNENSNDYIYVKIPLFHKLVDKLIYFIFSKVFKKKKAYSFRFVFQRICYTNRVAADLKKKEYDAILIENSTPLYRCLRKHQNYKKYSGKYFYHLHNEVGNELNCRQIIEGTQGFICVSNFIKHTLMEKDYINVGNQGRICVIKNPICNYDSVEKFNPFEKDKLLGNKIILYVGRLIEEKGIIELIKAIKKIKYQNYRLVIVGATFFNSETHSDFENKLKCEAELIKDKIDFTGHVNRNLLENYYSNADFCVLPSKWNEPAGLTMVESVQYGTPIITTNRGGIPEYLVPGTYVKIDFESDNDLVNKLAFHIEDLLLNDDNLNVMRQNCKTNICKYSEEEYASNIINIIREGLNTNYE